MGDGWFSFHSMNVRKGAGECDYLKVAVGEIRSVAGGSVVCGRGGSVGRCDGGAVGRWGFLCGLRGAAGDCPGSVWNGNSRRAGARRSQGCGQWREQASYVFFVVTQQI